MVRKGVGLATIGVAVCLGVVVAGDGLPTGNEAPRQPVVSPIGATETATVARRKAQFERLRASARADGSVRVIVGLDVPNYDQLATTSRSARGRNAVAFADGQLSQAIGASRQAELGKLVGTAHTINRTYGSVPFVALTVSAAALDALEMSPGVTIVHEDHVAEPTLNNTVNITGASAAWTQGYDGAGWYVAILDTGIRATHQFFTSAGVEKDIVQACFAAGENDGAAGDCPNGLETQVGGNAAQHHATFPSNDHGTHVTGIATGNAPTRAGGPLYGIARGADIIAIQVFSQFSDGAVRSYGSDQIAGLDYVYSLRTTYNIASANMSLGGGFYDNQAFCDADNIGVKTAIDNLRAVGIATVIASGNNGFCDGISGPGCISTAIAVGNTTDSDVENGGSNFHPTLLDLYAPGTSILSSNTFGSSNTNYASYTGTSMAAPHVAGAWAVLKQVSPTASVQDIFEALRTTGDPVGGHCVPPTQRRIQIDLALIELGIKFDQRADSTGKDLASEIDLSDMDPNVVYADDFISDGRPIHTVRWWGSNLGAATIDGWLISFHEPLSTGGAPAEPLGLYFCDSAVAPATLTSLGACDGHPVREYRADLAACCLIHANVDTRSSQTPAQADGFHEEQCFYYDLDIQAVVGKKFVDSAGTCLEVPTANSAAASFWGWHTTSAENGQRSALTTTVSGTDWLYGPWTTASAACSVPNMAFQLLTDAPATSSDCNNNEIPDFCESPSDCQPNGEFDECEIASGTVEDCNDNTIPDECDITGGASDCQPNDVPDECELGDVASVISTRPAVLGFVDIAVTGTPLNLGDDAAVNVTMPFALPGVGGPTVSICNNGGVGFVPGTQLGPVVNQPLPHANAFGGNPGMLVYWDDLHETTGNVYYGTIGSTPNQTFIVQWDDLEQFDLADGAVNGDEATFQVQIYENPVGGILAQYLYADTDFQSAAYSHGASATVGYQRSLTSAAQWSYEVSGAVTPSVVLSLLVNDLNDNGRPDACDPPGVTPDSAGGKTRALSFTGPPSAVATGSGTALKVVAVDLYHPQPGNPPNRAQPNFSTFDTTLNNVCSGPGPLTGYYCQSPADCAGSGTCPAGVGCTAGGETNDCARWVGPPFLYLESRDNPGVGSYRAARLQCSPYYQDWAGLTVHVLGSEIVPSSRYDVIAYASSCKGGNEGSCLDTSVPVTMTTRRGGDVFSPFNPPSTSPQPEGPDVAALVNKFKNLPGAIPKAVAQVQSNFPIPTNDVDGTDIAVVVDAVKGFAYGFSGPCICPSTVPCDTTVCSSNGQCAGAPGNYGTGAQCVRECQAGPRVGQPCTESVGDPPIPDLDCGSCSAGSPVPGIPCDANSDCSPGTCATGVCGAGGPATTGFCRDRCGRCE